MKTRSYIAKAIKVRMARKGISVDELAKTMGVRRETVSGWLNAKHAINLDALDDIAKALDWDSGIDIAAAAVEESELAA